MRPLILVFVLLNLALAIYVPNDPQLASRPYTAGIKTAHWKLAPQYHTNYSKVRVHNKNYTSSLLDNIGNSGSTKLYPVYSKKNIEKLQTVLEEHNSNIVEKDKLNDRVVIKRRIEKGKQLEIYNKCPKGRTGQFIYDLSCNQYLDCWKGRGSPRNCAPGTLFNPKTLECDFPDKVECITGPERSPLVQRSARYQVVEQPGCPEGFVGLIPNYTDCSKFVNCNDGHQTGQDCAPGTLFDVNLNVCNFPDKCTCFSGAPVGLAPKEPQNKVRCSPGDPDCVQYVRCDPKVEDCTEFLKVHNYGYSRAQGQHSESQGSQYGFAYGPQNSHHGSGLRGGQNLQRGPDTIPVYIQGGTTRDSGYSGQGPPVHAQGGNTQGSGDPQHGVSQSNYNKICNINDGSCHSPNRSPKCPRGFQGITRHPGDCKKFLNCANGITYVQDCAPGTLFNPNLSICDFPYNVDCGGTDTSEGTTLPYAGTEDHNAETYPQNRQKCNGHQCAGHGGQGQLGGYASGQTSGNQDAFQGQGRPGHGQHQGNVQGFHYVQGQGDGGQSYGSHDYNNPQGGAQGQIGGHHHHQGQNKGYGYGQDNQDNGRFPGQHQGQGKFAGYDHSQGHGGHRNPQGQHQGQTGGQHGRGSGYLQGQEGQGQSYGSGGHLQGQTEGQGSSVGYDHGQGYRGRESSQDRGVIQSQTGGQNEGQGQNFAPGANPVICQGYYCVGDAGASAFPLPNYGNVSGQHQPQGGTVRYIYVYQVPAETLGYQQVQPINKHDRATYGGFSNQRSTDYADIFEPQETRHAAKPTEAPFDQQQQASFPKSDLNADYVFEYEDGEPVTLSPEKLLVGKRKRNKCDKGDFKCSTKVCVPRSVVCDGLKDCDDGKDERGCDEYLDQFKAYQNTRLDVLEKQRWDNVSYATCALLCLESKKFECKSFNYRKVDRACFLTDQNIGLTGALKSYYPCDYYERRSFSIDCSDMHKCPSKKCLASEQICDGYNDCGDRADEKGCRAEDFGYQARLAGSKEAFEGRVEITVFGKTGYICDDRFTLSNANVLCKELGFHLGAAEVKGNSHFAKDLVENHTLYMMDDVTCLGNETSLLQCDFAGWGIHNCGDYEIVGVICKTPQEKCGDGFWKCDTGNECVRIPFVCDGLYDCTDNSDEAIHHCDSATEFRLVNGTARKEGRLEIKHHGIWGTVCDDDFNEDAAKIVCKHLGFSGSAAVKKDGYYGSGDGPIWLDQVSCLGNETSLEHCTHWDWGEHNCDHSEDVGVVCGVAYEVELQRHSKGAGENQLMVSRAENTSPEPVSCGYTKQNIFIEGGDVHFRVIQGATARPGDYPWQASLKVKGKDRVAHWCGAIVISSKWVLTAAHCLEGYSKGAYVIVAGEYDTDENEGTEQQGYIDEYYLHESFRKGHKMGNDIAMIRLKGAGFRLNQDIQPICLPDEDADYERNLNCTVSGFGTIQTGKAAYSHRLRAAWVPIQKIDICKMAHVYGEAIGDGMICAGNLDGGVDACDGDSGGPLACLEDGVFTLYGITSWGQRCGYANKPGVYVKVSYYKKWIEHVIEIHSL